MADIELVIKIPKRVYNYIRKYERIANSDVLDIKDAIINGTPLPKGHWTYYQNEKGNWINECSVCKCDAGVGYSYKYCHNCRAEMIK